MKRLAASLCPHPLTGYPGPCLQGELQRRVLSGRKNQNNKSVTKYLLNICCLQSQGFAQLCRRNACFQSWPCSRESGLVWQMHLLCIISAGENREAKNLADSSCTCVHTQTLMHTHVPPHRHPRTGQVQTWQGRCGKLTKTHCLVTERRSHHSECLLQWPACDSASPWFVLFLFNLRRQLESKPF
jgi:hypothetical protein